MVPNPNYELEERWPESVTQKWRGTSVPLRLCCVS